MDWRQSKSQGPSCFMTFRPVQSLFPAVLSVVLLTPSGSGFAQVFAGGTSSGGQVVVQAEGGPPKVTKIEGPLPPGVTPETAGRKPEEAKEGETKDGKPDEKKDGKEEKKDEKPATLKRPVTPPAEPDRTELEIRPDASGKVRFNFRGQTWPDVLDWLATVSGMSLDWQELPGDYLNLITQRSYTVQEARDLINRHLLARGYTLLEVGEVLTAVKTENINPALVPRVEPDALAGCDASRVRQGLLPAGLDDRPNGRRGAEAHAQPQRQADGADDHQPLGSDGRSRQLAGTVRGADPRAIGHQPGTSGAGVRPAVRPRHATSSEQLKGLLGIDSKSRGPQMPMSPQQMEMMQQQQQQMMMQMQQQQQQQGGRPPEDANRQAARGREPGRQLAPQQHSGQCAARQDGGHRQGHRSDRRAAGPRPIAAAERESDADLPSGGHRPGDVDPDAAGERRSGSHDAAGGRSQEQGDHRLRAADGSHDDPHAGRKTRRQRPAVRGHPAAAAWKPITSRAPSRS